MDTFDFSFYKGKKVLVTGHTGFKGFLALPTSSEAWRGSHRICTGAADAARSFSASGCGIADAFCHRRYP